jgi:hypothetical protein
LIDWSRQFWFWAKNGIELSEEVAGFNRRMMLGSGT